MQNEWKNGSLVNGEQTLDQEGLEHAVLTSKSSRRPSSRPTTKRLMLMLAGVMVLMLIAAGCGSANENESNEANEGNSKSLKEITVVLDWTPNTNHTGLYVAKENGYYEEQGLNVNIIRPGEAGAEQLVASGRAEFAVSYQEGVTHARVEGVPIVSIAAVIQHNTSGFASPVSKNIKRPKDFEGKAYGSYNSAGEIAVIDSLMKVDGADINKVKMIGVGDTDFFTAVKRDIDFFWIFYGWTGIEAELRNEPLNMIYVKDFSEKLDYYTPVLITNEEMIAEDPEVVKAFMAATTQGYQFAMEQPEQAADILVKAEPDLDAELVKASQKWLATRYQDDAPRWGEQKREVWENYTDWMVENGLIEEAIDNDKAFTNEFLPQ